MRIFFDCEFTGLHQNATLISVGFVSDYGATFYAEFTDYDNDQIDNWLLDNVMSNLYLDVGIVYPIGKKSKGTLDKGTIRVKGDKQLITQELSTWLSRFNAVEMWSDCLAYDWVLFCQLFGGGAECLPRNIYYIPFDIATLFKIKNVNPDINREKFSDMLEAKVNDIKHNALWDAKVIRACYEKLIEL